MKQSSSFFEQHPGIDMVEAFVVDVNGVPRGKWIPRKSIKKILDPKYSLRLPLSALAPDIWGNNVEASGLILETGDSDGPCFLVPETLSTMPWLRKPVAQALMTMNCFADPRYVLARILTEYKKLGLTPVVAAEMEFYLHDAALNDRGGPQPPVAAATRRRVRESNIYNLNEADAFRKTLADMSRFCHAQGIPADTLLSENGPGQYEVNLIHVPDALRAADHAIMLKRVIKGVAARDGMGATFMAKPYADKAGSGLHVHFSILDREGNNIFAGKDYKGTPALKHAIGGLLHGMADCTAIFAPNANSFRRFRPGSGAPTTLSWGYDNRSTALRIPESDIDATRIEHRVSGADVNPYLTFAAILAGALHGLKNKLTPPAAIKGEVDRSKVKALPHEWESALAAFERSRFTDEYFGKKYKKLYLACKRQEKDLLEREVSSAEHDAYLRDI